MRPVKFEPTIPANERPQTHVLERAATGIDQHIQNIVIISGMQFVTKLKIGQLKQSDNIIAYCQMLG